MLSLNDAAVQAEVHLKPHIVDTAMMYVQFCMSREGANLIQRQQQETIERSGDIADRQQEAQPAEVSAEATQAHNVAGSVLEAAIKGKSQVLD